MRKGFVLVLLLTVILLAGCTVGVGPQVGTYGWIYTDFNGPVIATDSNAGHAKVGTSTYTSILGLVATGDGSIHAAMTDGGITRIHHVDYKNYSILGVYHKMTVYVYGD
ncbi:MAG: hypothetical protein C4524_10575 [Candidatus Zixiibacteriota bacterium]|nr:MAG: hypothetical protein C4524_10575 [candidate division Zixibacteria bacterium]